MEYKYGVDRPRALLFDEDAADEPSVAAFEPGGKRLLGVGQFVIVALHR